MSFDLATLSFSIFRISSYLLFSFTQASLTGSNPICDHNPCILNLQRHLRIHPFSLENYAVDNSIFHGGPSKNRYRLIKVVRAIIQCILSNRSQRRNHKQDSFFPSSFDDKDVLTTCSSAISLREIFFASFSSN